MARKSHNSGEAAMENTEMSETTETTPAAASGYQIIKIAGRPFSIRAPYSAEALRAMDDEHLSIMANALNSLRGENVRNNVAAVMKSLAEKEDRQMTEDEVAAYDASYDIGNRRTRSGALQYDPIGKEERRLAQNIVDAKLREHATSRGLSFKEFRAAMDKDTYQAYITKAVDTGKFRALAERNIAERSAEAEIELDFAA